MGDIYYGDFESFFYRYSTSTYYIARIKASLSDIQGPENQSMLDIKN